MWIAEFVNHRIFERKLRFSFENHVCLRVVSHKLRRVISHKKEMTPFKWFWISPPDLLWLEEKLFFFQETKSLHFSLLLEQKKTGRRGVFFGDFGILSFFSWWKKKKKESEVFFLLGFLFPRKRDLGVREKRNLACLKTFFFLFPWKQRGGAHWVPSKKKKTN